ncbi:MAG: hypothetical protein WBX25_32090 [Rhodomicrobium sp.]
MEKEAKKYKVQLPVGDLYGALCEFNSRNAKHEKRTHEDVIANRPTKEKNTFLSQARTDYNSIMELCERNKQKKNLSPKETAEAYFSHMFPVAGSPEFRDTDALD